MDKRYNEQQQHYEHQIGAKNQLTCKYYEEILISRQILMKGWMNKSGRNREKFGNKKQENERKKEIKRREEEKSEMIRSSSSGSSSSSGGGGGGGGGSITSHTSSSRCSVSRLLITACNIALHSLLSPDISYWSSCE